MKKYILAGLITIAAFTMTSCNDYLSKAPENVVPDSGADYTKIENMYEPVSYIYSYMAQTSFSGWPFCGLLTTRTGDIDQGTPGDFQYCQHFQYSMLADYWGMNATWENLYKNVQYSNAALISLDKYREHIKATDTDNLTLNTRYHAEVRFLRAISFFYITRMWGDVPLLIDNNDIYKSIGKTPRADIYKFIIDELSYCSNNLYDCAPKDVPNHPGAVTKYTAMLLKAKALADIAGTNTSDGKWQQIADLTDSIIKSNKFALYPSFYNYFKKQGRLCNENLYELQLSDFGTSSGTVYKSDCWFIFQGPRQGWAKFGKGKIDSGWGFCVPNKQLVNFLKQHEVKADGTLSARDSTTLFYAGRQTAEGDMISPSSDPVQQIFNGKAYYPSTDMTDGRTEYGMGNNIRVLRYADALLLNAEANARLNHKDLAAIPLNEVRNRVGLAPINSADITVDKVLDERHAEFACEWGEEFFDLVRTNKAQSVLGPQGFVKGQNEFYPIPVKQQDIDPNLE